MKVPYNYLPMQFKDTKNIFNEWKKLIKSTDFTLGKYVSMFEKKFSNSIEMKYCISTNNGTDALILSLKSIGIKKGDEVITVTNTFYATVGAILAVGATPVFVDCDDRFQIDHNKIENVISKKTKVILPVHWGGSSPNMKKIINIAKRYNIKVVEDACMGIGASINNKSPGTFGICNAFSMHPLKTLNVMGDGGMVVTNNSKLARWMLKYRNHGMIDRNNIEFWGINMRLQPLQAIVAMNELKTIKSIVAKRNLNASLLDKALAKLHPLIVLPERPKGNVESFALYMCLAEDRNELLKFLNQKNIEAKIHYPKPLHLQKASSIFRYKKGDFPVSEFQADRIITLPVHQYLSKRQIEFIISQIFYFYKKKSKKIRIF
ncbi:MAG: dTDP-3-amino-3,6-dideoxy-alpha-D-galactopyranose transaminase [Alphaproteobacteria bacterium MarineAlpha5_Bin8]|nr:MAG: dTDP-3-amino-3,6-dideoxy-alpha-D-galactopyranose transaminase [Alphaproteobacteria bacterium MarineAlpha5_Bin8]PPR54560.1 MAG: dTDP-3-amino-3,6-dideoxy-alpha-D-galactopyranose transaminase [Alphaproteobacteria bacterium MarineAlpha5_Bin6]